MTYPRTALGFTLVEVLVAISVLSISILATFTAVSHSMRATNFTEDQIIAYYLADEALEYVRHKRDNNAIAQINALETGGASVSWLTGIPHTGGSPCPSSTVCYIDVPYSTITSCSSTHESCPVLLYNSTSGLYSYNSGTATQYKRSVSMVPISATELSVVVQVSWVAQGISKDYTQTLVLRNWAQ
jgi:type II secretion system protein I